MNTIFLTDLMMNHDSYDYMTETDPDDVKDVYTRRHINLKETYSYDFIP